MDLRHSLDPMYIQNGVELKSDCITAFVPLSASKSELDSLLTFHSPLSDIWVSSSQSQIRPSERRQAISI